VAQYTAYVFGVHDSLDSMGLYCLPNKVLAQQVFAIVGKYLVIRCLLDGEAYGRV
jgi:hypothetical protein